jgi:hypothetical protein
MQIENTAVTALEEKISQLREATKHLPPPAMPTLNFLCDGMYCRQIRIPEGVAFVGRKHKVPHYFMVLRGGAMVTNPDGGIYNLQAGMVLMCSPGAQRIGLTYADTIFVTVHRTDSTDLESIEDDVVEYDPKNQWGTGNEFLGGRLEKPE